MNTKEDKLNNVEDANIISILLDLDCVSGNANLVNFENDGEVDHTVFIKVKLDEGAYVVSSLPRNSSQIFITVTDGDPNTIAFLISEIDRANKTRHFKMNDVVRFSNEYMSENGRVGVILLPVSVSNLVSEIAHIRSLSGAPYEVFLCVFLSEEEYIHKKNFGFNSLMDKFTEENKDLISIG